MAGVEQGGNGGQQERKAEGERLSQGGSAPVSKIISPGSEVVRALGNEEGATAGPSQPTRTWLTILWELPEGDRVVLSLGEDPLNPIAAGDQGVAAAIPDDDPIDEEDGRQEQAEADNRVLIHLAGGAELREKYGE